MAKDVDGQLKQMVQDLKSIIEHLNTANTQQQDSDDPVSDCCIIINKNKKQHFVSTLPLILWFLTLCLCLDCADCQDFECTHEFTTVDRSKFR